MAIPDPGKVLRHAIDKQGLDDFTYSLLHLFKMGMNSRLSRHDIQGF